MIGRIAGRIDWRGTDHVLIDVRGVGYIVHCSERTLAALPGVGGMAALYTDLLVREDLLQLFGFPTLAEKEWHRLLMSVQGVGAKAALAILGALGAEGVSRAITLGDWHTITAAKGIGAKTAQRVVNELKDKAPAVMAMGTMAAAAPPGAGAEDVVIETAPAPAPAAPPDPGAQAEALSALTNLGYGPGEAAGAGARAAGEVPLADTAALIRAALRLLAPKG
ncbi:MAG: Holliday junction branch migration protein RuvA [Roseovarius sp.]|nr:Holliday junction branch migration protein RuvA [Roseovarius sp.]